MLVLSRKKNESIVIDDRIVITVVEIRGDKVRLGIVAPPEISLQDIYRALWPFMLMQIAAIAMVMLLILIPIMVFNVRRFRTEAVQQ